MEKRYAITKEFVFSDYQVRNWIGWHHHVALCLLTLWFLTEELFPKKGELRL